MAVALHTVTHPYFPLLPGPPAYDLTYLYAYVALFLQAGVIQTLGCLGALRLSQKLLNIYWFLLVALLLGDLIVGLIWFLRFPKLSDKVNDSMNLTLQQYGYEDSITEAWDSLQKAERCCGIRSSDDYSHIRWGIRTGKVPPSCCARKDTSDVQSDQAARHIPYHHKVPRHETEEKHKNLTCIRNHFKPFTADCERALKDWMHSSAEFLMILGFCVITFIKLCFVGILRFEIQEMIEKIKVLQGESANTPDPEMAAALGLVLPGVQGETDLLGDGPESEADDDHKGAAETRATENVPSAKQPSKDQPTELTGNGSSFIGIKDEPRRRPFVLDTSMSPLPCLRANILQSADTGGESDTNSHTALITDTPVRKQKLPLSDKTKHNGNNNEVTSPPSDTPSQHLYHVRQTQI